MHFYSHIPRGMWRLPNRHRRGFLAISTHTSLAGCDSNMGTIFVGILYFYSHIPRGMWPSVTGTGLVSPNFYSHIPRGMWHTQEKAIRRYLIISTHTSLAGCDGSIGRTFLIRTDFYSHIPRGMWRISIFNYMVGKKISTHTSLAGCDKKRKKSWYKMKDFYSHIPRGMWLNTSHLPSLEAAFLLTHPSRDVTWTISLKNSIPWISTHTSLAGCDHDILCIAS